jgi:hypothetical protein
VSDVLEGGERRRPPPRWVWALVGLVVAAGVVVAAVNRGGSHGSARPSPSGSPGSSPTPSIAPRTEYLTSTAPAVWPSVPGACGWTAYLPLIAPAQRHDPVDTTVMVGGAGLQSVTADGPTAAAVRGLPEQPGQVIGDVVAGPGGIYVGATPCDGNAGNTARVYKIVDGVARPIGLTADFLLGGAHHAWRVTYPPPAASPLAGAGQPGAVLSPLDGGSSITLETNAYPVADTAAGLVVARSDPVNSDTPPAIELLDAATGAVVRALPDGFPLAADEHAVLLQQAAGCGFQEKVACTLERVDLATATMVRSYPLPVGRDVTSEVALSPDGNLAAFQLTRATQDPRFNTGHPAPPSDVVVLHLDTGELDVVPHLELAPKTQAGLAFDNTSASLFITTGEGDHGELLIWRHGMSGPAVVTTVPGPIAGAPPILVLGGASAPS